MSPPVSACPFCGVRARFRPDLDPPPLPRWTLRPVEEIEERARAMARTFGAAAKMWEGVEIPAESHRLEPRQMMWCPNPACRRPLQSTSGQKSTEHGRAIAKWMLDLAERLREDTSSELNHALEVALESGPEEARTCR